MILFAVKYYQFLGFANPDAELLEGSTIYGMSGLLS